MAAKKQPGIFTRIINALFRSDKNKSDQSVAASNETVSTNISSAAIYETPTYVKGPQGPYGSAAKSNPLYQEKIYGYNTPKNTLVDNRYEEPVKYQSTDTSSFYAAFPIDKAQELNTSTTTDENNGFYAVPLSDNTKLQAEESLYAKPQDSRDPANQEYVTSGKDGKSYAIPFENGQNTWTKRIQSSNQKPVNSR